MNRSLLLVVIGLLFPFCLIAQQYPMMHYTIEDGLPSNTVYSVYRDSKGFLWFATDKGVARYNGLKFETFTTFDGLPDNEVFLFKEDHDERLWLCTYNGSLCYYKDGVFHNETNTPFLKLPFKATQIYNITLEKDSSLTFNFFNTFYAVNIKGDHMQVSDFAKNSVVKNYFNSNGIFCIIYKRKIAPDKYEIIYRQGVWIIDTSYNLLKTTSRDLTMELKYYSTQDTGYFISAGAVFTADLNDTIASLALPVYKNKTIRFYHSDGTNSYVGTNKGLIVNNKTEALAGDNITGMTEDLGNNYWVSTLTNGVYCLSSGFLRSQTLKNIYAGEIKYSHKEKYLYFVDGNCDLYRLENGRPELLWDASDYFDNSTISKDAAFLVDGQHNEYYYANKDGIFTYNWLTRHSHNSIYSPSSDIYGPKQISLVDNNMFIRGRSNITKIDYNSIIKNNTITYKCVGEQDDQRIFCMANTPDDTLWYATINGMYKYNGSRFEAQRRFRNFNLRFFSFFGKYIVGYSQDNQLIILNYLNKNSTVYYIPDQGCVWDRFYAVDKWHMLISTNNLYRLLTVNEQGDVMVSAIENSFIPRQAENICIDSVNAYFFKNASLTIIPKQALLAQPAAPKLFFDFIKTAKNEYQIENAFEISYKESKNITISFSRLVSEGQQIEQQYSFSKNDADNWKDIDGEEINIVNPDYGTYLVKLRAKSLSSNYSAPIVFTLHVLKPFWATWWFVSIVGLCAGVVTVLLIRYRIAYLLRRNEKAHDAEVKFIRSEYKALNALMNPHFIFNTLNNVQGLVNRNDKLAANEYLRVFADIIRQNMHNVSKEMIPLQKEVELVVNYLLLEKLRFKDLLNYDINIDDGVDLSEIMVPPLLIQPLVENSIKHGILPRESVEGKVVINIYERKNSLFIEVKDNGIGMSRSQERSKNSLHESYGMENIRKRIRQLSIIQNKAIDLGVSEIRDAAGNLEWTVVSISMLLG